MRDKGLNATLLNHSVTQATAGYSNLTFHNKGGGIML